MSDNIEWIYLRIEFAAMAMQGLQSHVVYGENDREWIAKESVAMADALIAELQKTK